METTRERAPRRSKRPALDPPVLEDPRLGLEWTRSRRYPTRTRSGLPVAVQLTDQAQRQLVRLRADGLTPVAAAWERSAPRATSLVTVTVTRVVAG